MKAFRERDRRSQDRHKFCDRMLGRNMRVRITSLRWERDNILVAQQTVVPALVHTL